MLQSVLLSDYFCNTRVHGEIQFQLHYKNTIIRAKKNCGIEKKKHHSHQIRVQNEIYKKEEISDGQKSKWQWRLVIH